MTWRPRQGQKYWLINSRLQVKETVNAGGHRSNERIKAGNCYRTKEEAIAQLDRFLFVGKQAPRKWTDSWWFGLLCGWTSATIGFTLGRIIGG